MPSASRFPNHPLRVHVSPSFPHLSRFPIPGEVPTKAQPAGGRVVVLRYRFGRHTQGSCTALVSEHHRTANVATQGIESRDRLPYATWRCVGASSSPLGLGQARPYPQPGGRVLLLVGMVDSMVLRECLVSWLASLVWKRGQRDRYLPGLCRGVTGAPVDGVDPVGGHVATLCLSCGGISCASGGKWRGGGGGRGGRKTTRELRLLNGSHPRRRGTGLLLSLIGV